MLVLLILFTILTALMMIKLGLYLFFANLIRDELVFFQLPIPTGTIILPMVNGVSGQSIKWKHNYTIRMKYDIDNGAFDQYSTALFIVEREHLFDKVIARFSYPQLLGGVILSIPTVGNIKEFTISGPTGTFTMLELTANGITTGGGSVVVSAKNPGVVIPNFSGNIDFIPNKNQILVDIKHSRNLPLSSTVTTLMNISEYDVIYLDSANNNLIQINTGDCQCYSVSSSGPD